MSDKLMRGLVSTRSFFKRSFTPLFYSELFMQQIFCTLIMNFLNGVWKAFYWRLVDLSASKRRFKDVFQGPYVVFFILIWRKNSLFIHENIIFFVSLEYFLCSSVLWWILKAECTERTEEGGRGLQKFDYKTALKSLLYPLCPLGGE